MTTPVVNEKSTAYLTVTFKDKNGQAQQPSSASYRIDDVDSGTEIKGDTVLSPTGGVVEITVSTQDTRILDMSKSYEKRLVTVKATYGSADGVNEEYEFLVNNLSKIT